MNEYAISRIISGDWDKYSKEYGSDLCTESDLSREDPFEIRIRRTLSRTHDDEFRPNEDGFDIEGTSQDLEEPTKEVDKKYWQYKKYWLELHRQMIQSEHFTGPQRSMNRTEKCEYLESEINDIEDQRKEFLEKVTRLSENDKKLIGETISS